MTSKHEFVISSRNTGQRIPCFDRCQLTITWMSDRGGKTATHAWEGIEPLEIKNGGRNLQFYHEIRDRFSTLKMDFRRES